MEMGMSSDRQVIHSTLSSFGVSIGKGHRVFQAYCRSGFGGLAGAAGLAGTGSPNIEPRMLDGRPAGLLPLVEEGARSSLSRTGGDVGCGNDEGRA